MDTSEKAVVANVLYNQLKKANDHYKLEVLTDMAERGCIKENITICGEKVGTTTMVTKATPIINDVAAFESFMYDRGLAEAKVVVNSRWKDLCAVTPDGQFVLKSTGEIVEGVHAGEEVPSYVRFNVDKQNVIDLVVNNNLLQEAIEIPLLED